MSHNISLHPRTHPSVSATSVGKGSGLPGLPVDLLQDVNRRLQFLFVIVLLVGAIQVVFTELADASFDKSIRYTTTAFDSLVTLAALAVVRWGKLGPKQLLTLGLGYQVFIAIAISVGSVEVTWPTRPIFLWSPIAVWILIFPIIVPNTTKRTALASGLCVVAEPLVAVTFAIIGIIQMPTVGDFGRNVWTSVLAAFIAIAIARMLYRLGEKLEKARSMGSYHLTDKLGAGGMGEVWKAEHRLLARQAAVKLIRPSALGGADEGAVDRMFTRFEQEAQATAQLQSPHTIEVYDFGVSRDGTFYYVMELLEGMDLSTLVERHGPQPPERLVRLMTQACHSLYEAHKRGLIHRDIKPANIFLCTYGEDFDFVKVLDFGLVKQRHTDADQPGVTQEGMISGTPSFMPPEMALGSKNVDGRADIYALGCVMYWLLTGHEVFEEHSTMAMLTAHISEEPPPVSTKSDQDVPADLDALITSCLAKKPEDRPETALELARRLRSLDIAGHWTDERAKAWWEEHQPEADFAAS